MCSCVCLCLCVVREGMHVCLCMVHAWTHEMVPVQALLALGLSGYCAVPTPAAQAGGELVNM